MSLEITRNHPMSPMSDAHRLLNGAPGVTCAFLMLFILLWVSSGTSYRDESPAASVTEVPVDRAGEASRIETYSAPSSVSEPRLAYPAPVGDSVSTETTSDVYLTARGVDCAAAPSAGSDGYMSEWMRP